MTDNADIPTYLHPQCRSLKRTQFSLYKMCRGNNNRKIFFWATWFSYKWYQCLLWLLREVELLKQHPNSRWGNPSMLWRQYKKLSKKKQYGKRKWKQWSYDGQSSDVIDTKNLFLSLSKLCDTTAETQLNNPEDNCYHSSFSFSSTELKFFTHIWLLSSILKSIFLHRQKFIKCLICPFIPK